MSGFFEGLTLLYMICLRAPIKLNYTGSERMYFRLLGGTLDWVFNLGKDSASKSRINLNGQKFYDHHHTPKHFEDFKQNIILRILDGRIQIIHDQKGTEYFPPNYVQVEDDRIIKTSFETLKISGEDFPRNWTIQPIEILSGHCFSHEYVCFQLFQHLFSCITYHF